ncbi:MAG TPA: serine kinase [Ruminococcaceae bacterium]|nr:serine kinase [Oscillospiraceae bacterium]
MFEQKIFLNNLNDIKKFAEIASSKDYEIELVSDKYVIDAKSITNIFTLDLTKPVTMRAHCENNGNLIKQVYPFIYRQRK